MSDGNGRSAIQYIALIFGAVVGVLSVIAVIVAAAWYGGAMDVRMRSVEQRLDRQEAKP